MNNQIDIDDIGDFVENVLREAFDEAGLTYNGAAFTKVGMLVESWAKDHRLNDGTLDIGDFYE